MLSSTRTGMATVYNSFDRDIVYMALSKKEIQLCAKSCGYCAPSYYSLL